MTRMLAVCYETEQTGSCSDIVLLAVSWAFFTSYVLSGGWFAVLEQTWLDVGTFFVVLLIAACRPFFEMP